MFQNTHLKHVFLGYYITRQTGYYAIIKILTHILHWSKNWTIFFAFLESYKQCLLLHATKLSIRKLLQKQCNLIDRNDIHSEQNQHMFYTFHHETFTSIYQCQATDMTSVSSSFSLSVSNNHRIQLQSSEKQTLGMLLRTV